MARPCYIYSKLKVPGPNGTITVNGNFKKAKECERGNAAFTEAVLHAEELAMMKKEVDTSELPEHAKTAEPKKTFKAFEDTKKVDLVLGDSSKQITIGSSFAWSSSSVRIRTSLHGRQPTCQVSRGNLPSTLSMSMKEPSQ